MLRSKRPTMSAARSLNSCSWVESKPSGRMRKFRPWSMFGNVPRLIGSAFTAVDHAGPPIASAVAVGPEALGLNCAVTVAAAGVLVQTMKPLAGSTVIPAPLSDQVNAGTASGIWLGPQTADKTA